ncbi:phosphoribosylglycinamide formyltransferase [Ruminococcaceae bacterium OttesenSCG-928-N02]|nr:phosphoribosylglycinamide formyltransferase [Ruminococcaceae bacterium OttesenSCG-928-N02]
MVKTAVFVSGGGTNLQALIDAKNNGALPSCELALVVASRADAGALGRAERANIPALALPRKEYSSAAAYDVALCAALEEHEIEFVVLAGFLSILGEEMVKKYDGRIINVHPSLIPSFCGKGFYGLRVHQAALAYGVKVTGASVHYVNEVPDGGRIIAQKAVEVLPGDTPELLQQRVMEQAEWVLLPAALESCCEEILKSR